MAPTIEVDGQVMIRLQEEASRRGLILPTHNQVLRQVLGIDTQQIGGQPQPVHELPTSHKPEVQALLNILLPELRMLAPNDTLIKQGRRWVLRPNNFVTLSIADKRKNHITITVYGNPDRFAATSLDVKQDRRSYSRFTVSRLSELTDAIRVIQRAHELKS